MYTAEIKFKRLARSRQQDHESAIRSYLIALERNGQIVDRDLAIVTVRGGYKAIVGLPEDISLRASRSSGHVRKELRGLHECGLTIQKVSLVGQDMDSDAVCECRKPDSLILETSFMSVEVPLRCGKCFGRVPLYRLPHTGKHGDYEDVRHWVWHYRALDTLWMFSGTGEHFAYLQLSRHDSDLSKLGRGICRRIEKNAGIPTYYYLYRWYARGPASERRRTCPSCGRKWLQEQPWMERYEFRCDRCRLVSIIGLGVLKPG